MFAMRDAKLSKQLNFIDHLEWWFGNEVTFERMWQKLAFFFLASNYSRVVPNYLKFDQIVESPKRLIFNVLLQKLSVWRYSVTWNACWTHNVKRLSLFQFSKNWKKILIGRMKESVEFTKECYNDAVRSYWRYMHSLSAKFSGISRMF